MFGVSFVVPSMEKSCLPGSPPRGGGNRLFLGKHVRPASLKSHPI